MFDTVSLVDATARRFDVIYMLGYGASAAFVLPAILKRTLWVNMDGLEWQRRKWSWVGRRYLKFAEWMAFRCATVVIVDAVEIGKDLEARHGGRANMIYVPYGADVYSGVTPTLSALASVGGYMFLEQEYYLVVARMEPENHIKEIIEGFLQSSSQKTLVLVGPLRDDRYCRSLQQFRRGPRVLFLGGIYDASMLQALRCHCSAYFHGHSVGGTNPSLLEAMAAGNIIVAHSNRFNREVLGSTGLFFSSPAELAEIIDELDRCGNSQRQEVARHAVQERVRRDYAWENIIERYNRLLGDVVGR